MGDERPSGSCRIAFERVGKIHAKMTKRLLLSLALGLTLCSCDREDPVEPSTTTTGATVESDNGSGGALFTYHTFTPPDVIRLCPQWIGGNRDFSGHGPRVNTSITLEMSGSRTLRARIRYHVKETQADWTEALHDGYITLYTAPVGKVIDRIESASALSHEYVDGGHGVTNIMGSSTTLAWKLVSNGDTPGNDVGNCTADDAYLSIYWNPIRLRLRNA